MKCQKEISAEISAMHLFPECEEISAWHLFRTYFREFKLFHDPSSNLQFSRSHEYLLRQHNFVQNHTL